MTSANSCSCNDKGIPPYSMGGLDEEGEKIPVSDIYQEPSEKDPYYEQKKKDMLAEQEKEFRKMLDDAGYESVQFRIEREYARDIPINKAISNYNRRRCNKTCNTYSNISFSDGRARRF